MHRLFLGCPPPTDVAERIAAWSVRELEGLRTTPAENLHVTLMFFGSVEDAIRDELVGLARETIWEPMPASFGELALFGRSALAARLIVPDEPLLRLEAKMVWSYWSVWEGSTPEDIEFWNIARFNAGDPLYEMSLRMPPPEIVRKRRRERMDRRLELHLTLARTKEGPSPKLLSRRMPPTEFLLDRLVLYESVTEPSGARYVPLAEAKRMP